MKSDEAVHVVAEAQPDVAVSTVLLCVRIVAVLAALLFFLKFWPVPNLVMSGVK